MKLSFEGLDSIQETAADVGELSDELVLSALVQSEEVADALTQLECVLNDGDQLDNIAANLTSSTTLIATEGLRAATFEFFNAQGDLNDIVGRELVWNESEKAEIVAVTLEGLKERSTKLWETIKKWFNKLIEWVKQLLRRIADFFISNEKILARMIRTVKDSKSKLRADAEKIDMTGVPAQELSKAIDEASRTLGWVSAPGGDYNDDSVTESQRALDRFIASGKSLKNAKELGYDDRGAVVDILTKAKKLSEDLRGRKTTQKEIEDEREKAIKAVNEAVKTGGAAITDAQKKEIEAAKKRASAKSRHLAINIRRAKFIQAQAMAAGRLWVMSK